MRSMFAKAFPAMLAAFFAVTFVANAENKVAYDQGYEVDETQLKGVYNSSASVNVESAWDFYVNAAFIYWHAKEQGLEPGIFNPTSPASDALKLISFPFEYNPGFKVGAGAHFDYDDWNVSADYTRLLLRKSHRALPPSSGFSIASLWLNSYLPFSAIPSLTLSNLLAQWKLNYNMFNLQCSRPYHVGKKLSFSPHAGLRGGWINQRYNLWSDAPSVSLTYESFNRSNSWMLGATAGLDSCWTIGSGFRFLANAAGSLCYQHFKLHHIVDSYSSLIGPSDTHSFLANTKDRKGQITPNLEGALGFGWGTFIDNNSWYFDLSAAYEFSYYWNQNKMRSLRDVDASLIEGDAGDLMFHGLTLNAKLDF